ncbi:MAG: 5' nucleotidase, NT5C type [Candidatus Micrarchaeia archaeon]
MEKKSICIDVDGTLARSAERWLEVFETERGINKKVEDLKEYGLEASFGISREEVREVFGKVWKNYENIEMTSKNAPLVIKKLRERYYIMIITAASANDSELISWFKMNDIIYDQFYHFGREDEKLRVDGDIIIEDNPNIALSFIKKGKKVILIEKPWNRKIKESTDGIEFAKDWDEIYKIIMKWDT